ncbi:(d)CMP kinase [Fusibacter paucivorans]|uniref:Cytidylate kinase n=1 Tax=Fusibacter paucivorans TaxID=76009 RepID=A0ABS5PP21_9FIRM|nr:(d)CMP kinase [Fusibacter paucivorans]MBS7526677.1 (d)CMP kinase [Fusibacter paucivorans]
MGVNKNLIQIAIDGPAGSGKSTVAKKLAQVLGFIYLDTGAMYRTVTLKALRSQIDLNDPQALKAIVDTIAIDFDKDRVLMDREDCTEAIRQPEVSRNVSKVAMDVHVREVMVKQQQQIASNKNVIMDGRDIGTHVLPNADYKFFLVASAEERASRRLRELAAKGFETDLKTLTKEIELRDKLDSERACAPLAQASDAICIDTTTFNIEEVVNALLEIIQNRKVVSNA